MELPPYQIEGIKWLAGRRRGLLADDPGLGKAQPLDEPVLSESGWIPIGSLKTGDRIYGSNGALCTVTGVFPQGVKEVFKIYTSDGAHTLCCAEHLWSVYSRNDRKRRRKEPRVLSLREIMDSGIKEGTGHKWFLPLVSPIQHEDAEFVIHPYILGALLANGCLRTSTTFHAGEAQAKTLCRFLPSGSEGLRRFSEYSYHVVSCGGSHWGNMITRELKKLGLQGRRSYEKSIPIKYMNGSEQQRKHLLAGLMDNDGCIAANGMSAEYNTTSEALALDVVQLVLSLGGVASIKTRVPYYTYRGEKLSGRTDYRIRIKTAFNPFLVAYKAERYVPRTKYPCTRSIDKVEQVGLRECVCISVDAADQLYVTRDYILTHNTRQALIAATCVKAKTVLIVTKASLIYNTLDEIEKWSPWMAAGIGPGFPVAVTSYESYRRHASDYSAPDVLILDEVHALKNIEAQITTAIYGPHGIAHRSKHVWGLSGTPLRNNLSDMYTHYSVMADKKPGWPKSYSSWLSRFCITSKMVLPTRTVYKIVGSKNHEQFRDIVNTFMLQRKKGDYLMLPPISYDSIVIPLSARPSIDVSVDDITGDTLLRQEAHFATYRRESGMAKVPGFLAVLREKIFDSEDKFVIFAHHTEVIASLCAGLGDLSDGDYYVSITGSTPGTVRAEMSSKFQNDPRCRIMVASIQAACEGHTWTSASDVFILEPSWVPADNIQAASRCHRIGQKHPVFCYFIVGHGDKVDRLVTQALITKAKMLAVIDGGSK